MAQLFPEAVNRAPVWMAVVIAVAAPLVGGSAWYFLSPEFTDVGYQPEQPIPFSHKLHAGELDIDCRYCHSTVEVSPHASIPTTQTCMNCHSLISRDSEVLEPLRDSAETGESIRWIRVHKLPEYAYFDHSVHVASGVGCSSCHGDVASMDQMRQVEPLSMGWCLDCHRAPMDAIRPRKEITNAEWSLGERQNPTHANEIDPSTDCSACHR